MNRLLIYAGIIAVLVIGVWGYGVLKYRSGLADGKADERAVWEEAQRSLRDQLYQERRAAQAKIDDIERQYLAEKDRDRRNIESLEQTIKDMEEADAADPASPRILFPRRLSDSLNTIGR